MKMEQLKQKLATTSDFKERKRLLKLIEQAKKIKPQDNQIKLL